MSDLAIAEQVVAHPICRAADASGLVPPRPGYYAIFIDDPYSLPKPFQDLLIKRQTSLIYIGIATISLINRLFEQDLRHQNPSTFFRAIGAILDYRPVPGSLAGMKNQKNYKFSTSDTAEVVRWIDNHVLVSWVEANPALQGIEQALIRQYCPIINTKHNQHAVAQLAALRRECRRIARMIPNSPNT